MAITAPLKESVKDIVMATDSKDVLIISNAQGLLSCLEPLSAAEISLNKQKNAARIALGLGHKDSFSEWQWKAGAPVVCWQLRATL